MKEFFIKKIFLPILDCRKGQNLAKYFCQFLQVAKFSRQDVEQAQNEKISQLINHAYHNTIYYRELFDKNGINPEDIKTKDDLKIIPPLTRELLQNNFENLQDKNHKYKYSNKGSSSGSTGQAVFYIHDEFGGSAGMASHYFGWYLAGYRFGDKGLHIWGNPAIAKMWSKKSSKFKSAILNIDKFPAYQLSDKKSFENLSLLVQKNNYNFIDGYTNAIYLFSKYLQENNIKIKGVNKVFTTAENLHDYQREVIEQNLGPVFDEYGCGEINGIAYQNKYHNDYAIMDNHVVVEFDDSIRVSDNSYPLIITDLDNRIMPLIRYKNGDLGSPGENDFSKIPFSRLKSVSGRVSDIIDLPGGGNLVVPSFFGSFLLKEIRSIKQYQVEKVAQDKIVINFVVNDSLSENDKNIIFNALDKYLNGKIKFEIKIVDKIEVSANGKFKLLIDKTKK